MKKHLIVILTVSLIVFGCKKENTREVPVLDIINAESLIVLESSKKSTSSSGTFYKITVDGSFEEVKFINPDGTDIDEGQTQADLSVHSIHNVSSEFVILTGSFSVWDATGNNQYYETLLVRKSDGAIFDFGAIEIDTRSLLGDEPFQHDNYGNFYYSDYSNMVFKVDISNPGSIVKSEYLSTGQEAEYFGIESQGNCIYQYGDDASTNKDFRLRKTNGGIFEVAISGRDNNAFWIGNNGKVYFTTIPFSNAGFTQPLINSLNIDNGNISIDTVWTPNSEDEDDAVGNFFRTKYQGSYLLRTNESVVFIGTYNRLKSFEFFESSNTVRLIDLPSIEEGAIVVNSDSYYYIATGTDLYKVSFSDHSYSKLLNTGEYEVYNMTASSDDIIQLSALRFSDGKKVFCQIDETGSLTTIDEEQNKKGIVLERLD